MTPRTLKQRLARDKTLARGFKTLQEHETYRLLGGSYYKGVVNFDIDGTIFVPVGTYERDYDLKKFVRDNSLFRNLSMEKLPLFYKVNWFYENGYYVNFHTARQYKWWLKPILKFWYGLKFHDLIQRPKGNALSSSELKKSQLIEFIETHAEFKNAHKIFIDDDKQNRDSAESLGWSPYDANVYNEREIT